MRESLLATLIRIDEGGVARVGGTRVTLRTLVYAYNQGHSAEGIQTMYPSLSLADVYGGIAYYLWHKAEVDAYVAEQEAEAERVRAEIEARSPTAGLWARLAARRG